MPINRPNYGDNEFAGKGVIKCDACGEPLRDHRIGPCPALAGETIYVASPRSRSKTPDPNPGRVHPRKDSQ